MTSVTGARDARLRDEQGREYVDLCAGYGTVWLGHNHPAVNSAIASQLERYAAPGYLPVAAVEEARAALAPFLPHGHVLGGFYSTGMEAVEVALRVAWAHTGRSDIAGFEGSTHGRSFLTSAIGARGEPRPPFVHALPSFASGAEAPGAALKALARITKLAAIVVEPVQMSGGGHEMAARTCADVFSVAREQGALVVFDETLTGLYRCGARHYADAAGVAPDILVLGKGLANGFPAAAVTLREGLPWDRSRVRPGSTFWNHPLACAAVGATLRELAAAAPAAKVRAIEEVVRSELAALELRGRGALWCVGSPHAARQGELADALLRSGVVVSYYDRYIRLLPPLAIGLDELREACRTIAATHAATFG
jgi:acetylornithine/succinyldiaminopimelate/putrescine aminotransferase